MRVCAMVRLKLSRIDWSSGCADQGVLIPDPVKNALNVAEAPVAILRLAVAIYPAGAWAQSPAPHIPPEEFDESWQLRSGLSSWAWRAIGELKDNGALGPHLAFEPP